MGTPAEFLYESCTCTDGMRDGLRCADCGGRGIVSRGTKITGAAVAPVEEDTPDDDLADLSKTHLVSRAKDLGLPSGGNKETLIKVIRDHVAGLDTEGAGGTEGATEGSDGDADDEDGEQS